MKSILIIGAGRSSSALITYLLKASITYDWQVRVGDMNEQFAIDRVNGHERGTAFRFDITNRDQRELEIKNADIVVSMLPATMHVPVAVDCVRYGKHLVTASYVSDAMRALHEEAKSKNVILLNEMGLDPGIDHMSAMFLIDMVRERGGTVTAFYSYCGGLVAPESNDNPWGYKFSWNPRNVILAGQGTAQYIEKGKYKYLPYQRVFAEAQAISIKRTGFEAYANRDSLSYRSVYGLENIQTMVRGTLRMEGFCKAWNIFVKLGLTDDTWKVKNANKLSYADLVEAFLPAGRGPIRKRVAATIGMPEDDPALTMVEWTGIFSDEKIPMEEASPAEILQQLLERKWVLKPQDKDMVVMKHIVEYSRKGNEDRYVYSLMVKGDDEINTAMAKTVGLPMAIAVKLILTGAYKGSGVVIPVNKDLYVPVLEELKEYGIVFGK